MAFRGILKCNTCCWNPFFCIDLHLLSACKSKEGIGQQSCARDQSVACTFLYTESIICATCLRIGANSVNQCKRACCHLRKRWCLLYLLFTYFHLHFSWGPRHSLGWADPIATVNLAWLLQACPVEVYCSRGVGRDRESDHRMRENKEDGKIVQEPWVGRGGPYHRSIQCLSWEALRVMKMRDSSFRPATRRRCGQFCHAFLCCQWQWILFLVQYKWASGQVGKWARPESSEGSITESPDATKVSDVHKGHRFVLQNGQAGATTPPLQLR